jgi:EAL and modified HD-GYP domain-containing signal transduction protein
VSSILRTIFPKDRAGAQDEASMELLNRIAPLKQAPMEGAATEPPGSKASFVFREAVLNRDERIAGYEFSLHRRLHSRFADQRSMVRRVYDDLLIRSLASFNVEQLLGHRLAFVDIAAVSLDNAQLASLPPGNTVLLLDLTEESTRDPSELTGQLASIIGRRFRVGCRLRPQSVSLLPEVTAACDFLQLLGSDFSTLQMTELLAQARGYPRSAPGPLRLMAGDLAEFDDFTQCFGAGFDYFHGPFITSRETWHPAADEHDHSRVIQLLNELHRGAQASELTGLIRTNPGLIAKLLRLVNAPVLGSVQSVSTLEDALRQLGRDRFYRALLLLLFDVRGATGGERAVVEQALARAHMMECLARVGPQAGLASDTPFIAGALSLADNILGQSIELVLSKVIVSSEVRDAVLHRSGPLGLLLQLVLACEDGRIADIKMLAQACSLNEESANRELLDALIWAQEAADLIR